jgi:hypothetical protein
MTADEQEANEREPGPTGSGREGAPPQEPADVVATDPETGSTPPDPRAGEVGLPPAGADPMAGEAPSG